jgi:ketosteroid isomerase-like protein
MSEENVEIIRRAYEEFNRGDWESVMDLAASEFEYVTTSGFLVGLSGTRGPQGFLRFVEQFWEEFDEVHAEAQEVIEAGDSVLAVIAFSGRGKQSGAEVNLNVCQLWTLRDRKVIRGQGFFDRAEALEAAGLRE